MTHATPRLLRRLILAEVVCGLTSVVFDLALEDSLPAEIRRYIARSDQATLSAVQVIGYGLGSILLIGLMIGWIGLWRLWRPARRIYTICWLLGVPLYLLIEPVLYYTPLGAMFSEYSVLAAGMTLGVVYFSDLSLHFAVPNAEPCAPPNGGPATPLGNVGVTEGPPSVS